MNLPEDKSRVELRARQLRLAVITNLWKQLILSEKEAKLILTLELSPGDNLSRFDDSALLGDLEGLEKLEAEYELE